MPVLVATRASCMRALAGRVESARCWPAPPPRQSSRGPGSRWMCATRPRHRSGLRRTASYGHSHTLTAASALRAGAASYFCSLHCPSGRREFTAATAAVARYLLCSTDRVYVTELADMVQSMHPGPRTLRTHTHTRKYTQKHNFSDHPVATIPTTTTTTTTTTTADPLEPHDVWHVFARLDLLVDTKVMPKDANPSYMFQSKADDLV